MLIKIFYPLKFQLHYFIIDVYFQEIEGVQYDIRITGDPVIFNGEKFVKGEDLSTPEVIYLYNYTFMYNETYIIFLDLPNSRMLL